MTVCIQNGPAVQDQLLLKQDMLHVMEVQRVQCERQSQTLVDETEHWKGQGLQTKQDFTGMPTVLAVLTMRFYTHSQSVTGRTYMQCLCQVNACTELWLSNFGQIALTFCNVLQRLSVRIQTKCHAFYATPPMDIPILAFHASFVRDAGKAGTQHIKQTLLYACAEMQGLAAFQHRKIQSQSIAFINLQKRAQALVDSTADMTVQLVLFKCYLDTADKHDKALKVCLLLCVFCNSKNCYHNLAGLCVSVAALVSYVAISSFTSPLVAWCAPILQQARHHASC